MKAPVSLTVLARVRDGAAEQARAAAQSWNELAPSPFARLPGVHLGRVQLIPQLERHVRKAFEDGSFLLLSLDHDGDLDPLLDAMSAQLAPELDALLGCCDDWPGAADRVAVRRWMRDRRAVRGVELIAYPKATVEHVLQAIGTHERVVALACRVQRERDPAALRAAFLAAFPEHAP